MAPHAIYENFRLLFPLYNIAAFSSVGKHSIRLKTLAPKMEFIFTYKSPSEWRFETLETFGSGLKEKK